MNAMTMTETIMGMIRTAGVPAEEIAAALLKAAAKTKGKPTLISTQAQAQKAGPGTDQPPETGPRRMLVHGWALG
jgi:hypothetical protein